MSREFRRLSSAFLGNVHTLKEEKKKLNGTYNYTNMQRDSHCCAIAEKLINYNQ